MILASVKLQPSPCPGSGEAQRTESRELGSGDINTFYPLPKHYACKRVDTVDISATEGASVQMHSIKFTVSSSACCFSGLQIILL